jgi:site-specific recombinase XerD
LAELQDIEPVHVAAYIEILHARLAAPSVKLHLAAIRMLFDWMVIGQIIATNPASSVRGPRHSTKKGKTPVLAAVEARTLLDSIHTNTLMGLRDRALIGLMVYSFARVGAALSMRVEDVYVQGLALGCACMKKVASAMKCLATITWMDICTPILMAPS